MENQKSNKGVVALLIVIIAILAVLCVLFATDTISFKSNEVNNDDNMVENNNDQDDNNEEQGNDDTSVIEVTLPSDNKIFVSKEFNDVFSNTEKILLMKDNEISDELILSELLKQRLSDWPDDFYTGKEVSISSVLFDFDEDGINEIMFSFCEEYLLLHYYNGKVYAYSLGGYRTNGNWRVNGVSFFFVSAFIGGYTQYSFNGNKLINKEVASRDDTNGGRYLLDGGEVDKTEFDNYLAELEKVPLIDFVDYSEKING